MEKFGNIKAAGPKATISLSDRMKEKIKEKGVKILVALKKAAYKVKNVVGLKINYIAEHAYSRSLLIEDFLKMKAGEIENAMLKIESLSVISSAGWNAGSANEINQIISKVFELDPCD